jgi:hypothetical protein
MENTKITLIILLRKELLKNYETQNHPQIQMRHLRERCFASQSRPMAEREKGV